jgi:hypothetical protein
VLKHSAANRKRRLSALPNVGPYIHDISRLRVNKTLIFSTNFRKNSISNLIKIRPVEAELFHEDGQTDSAIAAFSNFSEAQKKEYESHLPVQKDVQICVA